jgi:hypothetical protein
MTKTDRVCIIILLSLIVIAVCIGICATVSENSYHNGEKTGAKIALSIHTIDSYRMKEVRGECADLFGSKECTKCHTLDFLK